MSGLEFLFVLLLAAAFALGAVVAPKELIDVGRAALFGLRSDGRLPQDALRNIERDLDPEEARLSAAA